MKPGYPYQPQFQQVQVGRAEPMMAGVGVTLLVVALAGFGVLLLAVIPGLYDQLFRVLGSRIMDYRALSFLGEAHGVVFVAGAGVSVIVALLLSRTRRPGLALLIEGIVLLSLGLILALVVWQEAAAAGAGIWSGLNAGALRPLQPIR